MTITTQSKPVQYLFTKDLAALIIHAEVKHFAAEANPNGPTEDELRTLTRRLSWLVDRDLKWTDVEQLTQYAAELRRVEDGTHPDLLVNTAGTVDNSGHVRDALLLSFYWEINLALGAMNSRWEWSA